MFNKASKGALKALVDDVKAVVAICESCPFQALCLNEGMKGENVDYGIWGGKLAAQRQMEQGWSHENIAWGSLRMSEWRLLGIVYPHLKTWPDGIYRKAPVPKAEPTEDAFVDEFAEATWVDLAEMDIESAL